MRLLLVSLSTLWVGCIGFQLTPDARPCGTHAPSGMDVYVDSKGMTCSEAFATIQQAMDIGHTHTMWLPRNEWGATRGIEIEFIGGTSLAAIGEPSANGYTQNVLFTHQSAIAYGDDSKVDYTRPYVRGAPTWPSAVILAHEMVHMVQTQGFLDLGSVGNDTQDHCHWSVNIAPLFADLGWAQFSSNFVDKCEHKQCSGAACVPEAP